MLTTVQTVHQRNSILLPFTAQTLHIFVNLRGKTAPADAYMWTTHLTRASKTYKASND